MRVAPASLVALLVLAAAARTVAADQPPGPPRPGLSLPTDPRLARRLQAARDYAREATWVEAITATQAVLDAPEDAFLTPAAGDATSQTTSLRGEALRLLRTLPLAGREAYEAVQGARARGLYRQALADGDRGRLAEVARRFPLSAAALDAAAQVAGEALDRGRPGEALAMLAPFLEPGTETLPPRLLVLAALAARQASQRQVLDRAWDALRRRCPDGVALGGQKLPPDALRARVDAAGPPSPPAPAWAVARGDPARGARATVPPLDRTPLWSTATLRPGPHREALLRAAAALDRSEGWRWPGAFPLVVGDRVVGRDDRGVRALDARTGRPLWHAPFPRAPATFLDEPGRAVAFREWWKQYGAGADGLPLENSVLGQVSSDGARVYAVDDVPLPPHPPAVPVVHPPGAKPPGWLADCLVSNRLRAVDLETGALVWESRAAGLAQGFFRGPPLPVDGRLYALFDGGGELRLLTLDPARGSVLASQTLATLPDAGAGQPVRRVRGIVPALAGGRLVCPSDAGGVFAWDLAAGRLAWAHLYPRYEVLSVPLPPGATFVEPVQDAGCPGTPVLADGLALVAPGDAGLVLALDLRDGRRRWQAERPPGSFIAGVARGLVLLAGADRVWALRLEDGRTAWSRAVGPVAGQGIVSGEGLLVPLKLSRDLGEPTLASLDVATGRTLSLDPWTAVDAPGHLAAAGTVLVSQSARGLTAFSSKAARLKEWDLWLAAAPADVAALLARGEARLGAGDQAGGLEDFRRALAATPPGEPLAAAQARYHEALLSAVRRDPATLDRLLEPLRQSCRPAVPEGASPARRAALADEAQRRAANARLAEAAALAAAGQPVAAVRELAGLYAEADRVPGRWRGLESGWQPGSAGLAGAGPGLPAPALRGRVLTLLGGLVPTEREGLGRWLADRVAVAGDVESLRGLVDLFGDLPGPGDEARLRLAVRLAGGPPPGHREAELHLLTVLRQRERPAVAARAGAALAELLTRQGHTEDARALAAGLARDFPGATPGGGRTAADGLRDLDFDPRFLLTAARPPSARGFTTEVLATRLSAPPADVLPVRLTGDPFPSLGRQEVLLYPGAAQLVFRDGSTGAELGRLRLPLGALQRVLHGAVPGNDGAWLPLAVTGRVAVLTLGSRAYGLDLRERQLLWSHTPAAPPAAGLAGEEGDDDASQSATVTREGRLLSVGPGGLTPHLLGSEGPVWPQGVAAVFGREVVGLGPLDGRVLWRQPIQAGVWRLLGDGPVVLAAALDERPERAKSDARIARGFRRADGLEVAVGLAAWKDSDPVWEGRLLQWTVANGGWRLVLRDLPAGREAWTHPVELGWVLDSDVPTQYGLLGLDGTLTVFDLRAGRQVLRAAVPPDHMKGMRSGTLLADADGWVLVLDRQRNPGEAQAGGAASELVPGSLRPLLVNGTILAFDRRGRLRWEVAAAEQCLLREHLAELPVLLLVRPLARDTERPREPPGALVTSFDKATGRPVLRDHAVPGMGRLRAVWVDDRTGTVDLVGGRKTLRHRAVD